MTVRVVLNYAAFNALRNSPAVKAEIQRRADAIAAAAGDGFTADRVREGRTRAWANVYADTIRAKRGEAKDHRLTRAIDAGR